MTGNVRALRNALEGESQRVEERSWRAQEELTELERRIEDASAELSGLRQRRFARRSGAEQAADAALDKVLSLAVGEVLDAVQTGQSEGEIGPGERLLAPPRIWTSPLACGVPRTFSHSRPKSAPAHTVALSRRCGASACSLSWAAPRRSRSKC